MAARIPSRAPARPSLATWLFIASMIATVTAVLTCTAVIDRFMRAEARTDATEFLQAHADALRDALDRGMAQQVEEVRVIGQLDALTQDPDPLVIRRTLEKVRASFPQFAWLGLADESGRVVAAVDGLLEGQSVAARPWFTGARDGLYVGDVHRAVLLEKLLPVQAEPWRFVDIATPVVAAEGRRIGVLGAHLSWTWAARIKRELVDRVLQQHAAEAFVVAADGTVLLGPGTVPEAKLPRADPETTLAVESRTHGEGAYPGLGWNVVLRQPEAVAMGTFRVLQRRTAIAAALLCALFAPLLWMLAYRLATPLRELEARLAGTARVEPRPRPHPLYREAALLRDALDQHDARQAQDAAHLRELNAGLEARVAERTAALADSKRRLRTITDNLPALIAYIDREERYRFCNGTYKAWLGQEPEQIVGRAMAEVLAPAEYAATRPHLRRALAGERVDFDLESTLFGVARHLNATFLPDADADGRVAGVYALVTDISELKAAEREMALQARTDALTRLTNRHGFEEKLAEALARSRRSKQAVALFYLDVDKFKAINDSLGHGTGDEVLKEFGRRLAGSVRETDTVARLAGDEFVVILEGLHAASEPQIVAGKILAAVNRPFEIAARTLDITTSIGIAYEADGRVPPADLLARADRALYEAKAAGRNAFRLATREPASFE